MSSLELGESYLLEAVRRLLDARLMEIVTGADPAASAEFSVTVPGGEYWEVLSVVTSLATDATVANRTPALTVDDGTTVGVRLVMNVAQTASTTLNYEWGVGLPSIGAVGGAAQQALLLRQFIMPAGWRLRSSTVNLQAGDNWGAPVLLVRRISPYNLALLSDIIRDELSSF